MKNMVNDFRDYARTPLPQLAPVDLAALLGDVLDLYQAIARRDRRRRQRRLPACRRCWPTPTSCARCCTMC
jgi:nitrogen fixation/metabolism regulation signal transduction histidine kinase